MKNCALLVLSGSNYCRKKKEDYGWKTATTAAAEEKEEEEIAVLQVKSAAVSWTVQKGKAGALSVIIIIFPKGGVVGKNYCYNTREWTKKVKKRRNLGQNILLLHPQKVKVKKKKKKKKKKN